MNHAEKGFTLFEVLAAIALAGISLVVILQLFSANIRALSGPQTIMLRHQQRLMKSSAK